MPNHGSHCGSHIGGGGFSGSRHLSGGGSFGGSRSSGSYQHGGHVRINPTPSIWMRPRVVILPGRRVYLSTKRGGALVVLVSFLAISLFIAFIGGIVWAGTNNDLAIIRSDYNYYHQFAVYAKTHPEFQIVAEMPKFGYEPCENDANKYCIAYEFSFTDSKGKKCELSDISPCIYTWEQVQAIIDNDYQVVLALNMPNTALKDTVRFIPLDYADTVLEDEVEYVSALTTITIARIATFVGIGLAVALLIAMAIVGFSAPKATPEQIAENENKQEPSSTWRCSYCNSLNDNAKTTCDSCGARRQK